MKKNPKNQFLNPDYFIRVSMLILMFAFLSPVMTNAQSVKVNFSGTWNFNTGKSTLGDGGGQRMGGGNLTVTQDGNLLTVVRIRTGQDGQPSTTTMKYTLDGKECVNTSPRGESKSVVTCSADGKVLTIGTSRTRENNGETRVMKSTEEWKLTDAKTLVINSTRQNQDGETKSTLFYDKQ